MWIKRSMKHLDWPDAEEHAAEVRRRRNTRNVTITPRHGVFLMTWEELETPSHPNYPNYQRGHRTFTVQWREGGDSKSGFETIEEAVEWGLSRKRPSGERAFDVSAPDGDIVWSWSQRPHPDVSRGSRPSNRQSGGRGRKILATSFERYNGGVRIKRQYGSSTVTRFYVRYAEDDNDPSKWKKVEGYGRTPGERKTDAIRRSGLLEQEVSS